MSAYTDPAPSLDASPVRESVAYSVRLPDQLDAAIRAEAARHFEPLSVVIRRLLRRALEQEAAR